MIDDDSRPVVNADQLAEFAEVNVSNPPNATDLAKGLFYDALLQDPPPDISRRDIQRWFHHLYEVRLRALNGRSDAAVQKANSEVVDQYLRLWQRKALYGLIREHKAGKVPPPEVVVQQACLRDSGDEGEPDYFLMD